MDFYKIVISQQASNNRSADFIVYPDFVYASVKDIVCKGGALYAFWDNDHWNQELNDLIRLIDSDTEDKVKELKAKNPDRKVIGKYFKFHSSGIMTEFKKYEKFCSQSTIPFNTKIIFSDVELKQEDYATRKLSFTPTSGPTPAFDDLMSVLYEEEEQEKILWFIGALLTNNMPKIQKFMYLYGGKGSGKGTVINIFKQLFESYYKIINLSTLTAGSDFATHQIEEVPLLIDEDSNISKIKNDTYLLKITAHEPVSVNMKYKTPYDVTFNGLLITASNQRYQVRDVDSGITRRAVVVSPTSRTHPSAVYNKLISQVKFEIPMIAQKGIDVFNSKGIYYYEGKVDTRMIEETDHIFAFVKEYADRLGDVVTLKQAAEMYKTYLEDIGYNTDGYKRKLAIELQRYYRRKSDQQKIDGLNVRNVYSGFKRELLFPNEVPVYEETEDFGWDSTESFFDKVAADYPAQLASSQGTPLAAWDDCVTTLKDIDTHKLHYVRVPLNHIVIDFDMKDENGEKNLAKNLEAIKKFPPTYSELSKSGQGIHLHYIYDGDVVQLASLYEDDVEIKVFTGKQSLRRLLTKCNDLPIAHITTGLPTKQKDGIKVYQDVEIITWNEKKMRTAIKGNLSKKYHNATKPSMDFIKHIFEKAEKEGVKYDLNDMRQDILIFATKSRNNAQYCIKVANGINYKTIDDVVDVPKMQTNNIIVPKEHLTFFDVEVYPNLFVVAFKDYGKGKPITKWFNPTPAQIESLMQRYLVAFNCRKYDNHIMYARLMGEDLMSLYRQSQRIINSTGKEKDNGLYSAAYELSYVDIYDYTIDDISLKKWEIKLGILHDEMELPWDQPVPEHLWERVGEYCGNDVLAAEAVFDYTAAEYNARLMLSRLSGLSVNSTTNQHSAKFLFGDEYRPQDAFVYTDLSETFPGYKYEYGKSEYRGEVPSEGGFVHAEPGVYTNVRRADIESMHPRSLINMNYFGKYTQRFADLVDTRLMIKHKDYAGARKMFDGILAPYLNDEASAKELGFALKIIINIVYGMTSAKFDNKFRHPKNIDNIVAKRGALFMIDLMKAVQEKGFVVAHIKTDSIKIPDATDEIMDFVKEFGQKYGYTFEEEQPYQRMALVNKSVFIAQHDDGEWEAVGSQFAEPYVYKKLFTHEDLYEIDYAITKAARAPIYLGEKFVGKVAQVYASLTGQDMLRVEGEKRSHILGTKNYGWRLFSDFQGHKDIDMSYYEGLAKSAISAIEKVGPVSVVIDPFPEKDKPIEDKDLPF